MTLDLSRQTEVSNFTDELGVDEHVTRGQVSVHVVHLAEVLHAGGYAPEHAYQLQHLELAVVDL